MENCSGKSVICGVYLLHFTPQYKHAKHYLGWSDDVLRRIEQHLSGGRHASPLVQAALRAGSAVTLVRVWPGADRTLEALLKRRKESTVLCPLCNPERAYDNGAGPKLIPNRGMPENGSEATLLSPDLTTGPLADSVVAAGNGFPAGDRIEV